MSGAGKTLAKAALTIAAVTVAARVVGLGRTVVMARLVADDPLIGNAYASANTLPNVVFEVVAGGALATAVIPVVVAARERGTAVTEQLVSALLTWTVLLLVPVALLGVLLSRPLMRLLTSGVDDAAAREAVVGSGARMLVVFMPQVVLYGVGIVLTGILQAHRRFLAPALAPLLSSLVVVAAYVLYESAPSGSAGTLTSRELALLAGGTTLGVVVLALSLVLPVRRLGLRLRPTTGLPPRAGAELRALAAAGFAGLAAQHLALLVVLVLANPLPGGVVAYQVAQTAFLLPWAVLAVPVATSAFPHLAEASTRADDTEFDRVCAGGLRVVCTLGLLGAAALIAVADPAARLLYGVRDSGAAAGSADLADAIVAFAPGLVGYAVLAFATRALFARGRARPAAVATVVGFAVVVGADVLLVSALPESRVAALGAGHSVGMTVAGVLLVLALRTERGAGALRGVSAVLLRGLAVAGLGAVAGGWLASRLDGGSSGGIGSDVLGVVVGGGVVLLVGVLGLLPSLRADLRRLRGSAA